ncbi:MULTISPECIES: hypothetical protein [Methylobacterium]|nr:hypothetical protein [Methylobacterium sp. 13MFTsu3.1M2]
MNFMKLLIDKILQSSPDILWRRRDHTDNLGTRHYLTSEMPGFDREYYLKHNRDAISVGENALEHYLEVGWKQGRDPSPGFSGQRYLAWNPDVAEAGLNPLVHYLNYGLAEGRLGACDDSKLQASSCSSGNEDPSGQPLASRESHLDSGSDRDSSTRIPVRLL